MSRQIQIRRGTADEHTNFTGAIGEVTMDTTNNTLRVHDGETVGGTVLAKQSTLDAADYVVETQLPTAENNYTWYRKYKSGWVEQGGYCDGSIDLRTNPITLPIAMQNAHYTIMTQVLSQDCYSTVKNLTETTFMAYGCVFTDKWYYKNFRGHWSVSGISGEF